MNKSEIYIEKAKKIHYDKYDYSLVDYINSMTKIKIICPEHGIFEQKPSNHLTGNGCPNCAGNKKLTKNEYLNKVNKIHNNYYDYSKFIYVNTKTKGIITCPKHGDFFQSPNHHLYNGCPKCGSNSIDQKKFIEESMKIHGNNTNYLYVNYVDSKTKVKLKCPKHGFYYKIPYYHLKGEGCPKCSKQKKQINQTKFKEIFISDAINVHGEYYNYSKFTYVNSKTKGIIICPKHGDFFQSPNNHLRGQRCPKCSNKQSRGEKTIENFLIKNNIEYVSEYSITIKNRKRPLFIDFYLPKYKIAIECHGEQHFKINEYFGGKIAFNEQNKRDKEKYLYCIDNKIYYIQLKSTLLKKIKNTYIEFYMIKAINNFKQIQYY